MPSFERFRFNKINKKKKQYFYELKFLNIILKYNLYLDNVLVLRRCRLDMNNFVSYLNDRFEIVFKVLRFFFFFLF